MPHTTAQTDAAVAEKTALKDLRRIPGIGPRLAQVLLRLGYTAVTTLRDQDPEDMYQKLMDLEGKHVDRCVLYVFRCAVYFSSAPSHDPELLKWWNWKDQS
ncbi:MAG: helix-hairpin-helix domain-containing protein [Proteobacteria bacterium]|nr:helix-hairpin-helix domain-containing protein [Pseudomonadota bacterium]MBU1612616.1 helix-hairpin-helix domain-containing protein [Pseudomonadota bacterium]